MRTFITHTVAICLLLFAGGGARAQPSNWGQNESATDRMADKARSVLDRVGRYLPVPLEAQTVDHSNGAVANLSDDHRFKLNTGQNLPMQKPDSLRTNNPYVENAQHGKAVWGFKLSYIPN